MLRTLISAIQGLLANHQTPAAKAASRILLTVISDMKCLENDLRVQQSLEKQELVLGVLSHFHLSYSGM